MLLSELDYALPDERIAQYPPKERGASRMLLLEGGTGKWQDCWFGDLPDLLHGDELLVVNNARVIPARLLGRRVGIHASPPGRKTRKEHLTGEIEVLLTRRVEGDTWEALVHPGRKIKTREVLRFGKGELEAEVLARGEFGLRHLHFRSQDAAPATAHIDRLGHIPLPPYIRRPDEESDRERYQTIFASRPGAVAAPTAGLHFTPTIREAIRRKGVEICELTLHVGLGTFQPIRSETLEGHRMHDEAYEIPPETAECVEAARKTGRPILAVGTTVVRALEDAALRSERSSTGTLVTEGRADASVFVTPGFRFRVVDALLTNFHLPRSSLLAMVCAFAGRERVLAAYRHAVEAGYRFYSYGDCMLIR
jgi:S-adenosylmethionine:tRNA ribosyltransferase-isomerase